MMKNRIKALIITLAMMTVSASAVMPVYAGIVTNEKETDYVKETIVNYTSIFGEEMKIHVSADQDLSELLLRFDFYDDEVEVKVCRNEDGEYEVTDGSFFATDGKQAAEKAVKEGKWKNI